MNCLGRSGKAVGLSAISLLAFCFLLTQKICTPIPFPVSRPPNPETLAKDAAPIPNALAAIKTRKNPRNPEIRQFR